MIIERDTVGRIHRSKTGKYYFRTKFEDGTVAQAQQRYWWSTTEFRRVDRQQKRKPIGVLNLDDLSWWLYQGKIFLTKGNPRPTEVANFLEFRRIMTQLGGSFFPKDAAFKFRTVGKRKPPSVPLAEIIRSASGEFPAPRKRKRSKRDVPTARREYIPDHVKIFVWRRDGGRCVTCSRQERLEFDHIIPVSKGGSNTARNLQLLCERCNRKKGSAIA